VLSALILTAGLGTRLDPLTRLVAKPVVPLAGKTLLERVLEWLRREGVRDVVMNLHHRPETIAAVIGDGTHLGLRVRYSWEPNILGSAGGPHLALPLLPEDLFLLVNGDTLASVPLAPMIDAHRSREAAVTMAVVPNPRPDHYNSLVLDDDDRLTGFALKGTLPPEQSGWHFIGIQVATREAFSALAPGVPAETVSGIYRDRIVRTPGDIRGWRLNLPFVDVGTPRDYLHAALALAGPDDGLSVIEPGAQVHETARVERSVVWPGARVGARAQLDRCVVAGAVAVPDGFQARSGVIVPSSVARPGDRAEVSGDLAVFALT
jgi:mannose-1-phosphate guanylyltransferase